MDGFACASNSGRPLRLPFNQTNIDAISAAKNFAKNLIIRGSKIMNAILPPKQPANTNIWYCLATLYGEQPTNGQIDNELAEKNMTAWNKFVEYRKLKRE
ncbi:MAG: hypothetical protein KGQ46_09860 [Hyphomicrobiales bacterium]|nr:hypothetical protein [Hyphomicrobiales bacterium]MDE2115081.1 hypothetical protein [Hyphomicrobiales bacterium]